MEFSISQWLVTIGAGIGVAPLLSWILERMGWFQEIDSSAKQFIVFVSSAIISVCAFLVLKYVPANILKDIEPIVGIVVAAFTTFYGTQLSHATRKVLQKKGEQ